MGYIRPPITEHRAKADDLYHRKQFNPAGHTPPSCQEIMMELLFDISDMLQDKRRIWENEK